MAATASARATGMSKDEKFVILASSLGTVFEWYDFYLYATLAPFFAALFFPPGNDTAALLSAFATYAAGFLVRPFGAIIFGRIGDIVGRKYTFLVTIVVMGGATFLVGLLPTFGTIGWAAPFLLVTCALPRASRSAANMAAQRLMWRSMQGRMNGAIQQATFRPRRRSASSLRCW
jgi:MFS family permease